MSVGYDSPAREAGARTDRSHRSWERAVLVLGDTTAVAAAATLMRLPQVWVVAVSVTTVLLLGLTGQHRPRLSPSLAQAVTRLVAPAPVAAALLGALPVSGAVHVTTLLRAGLVAGAFLLVVRAAVYETIRRARRRRVAAPTLIVGAGKTGVQLAQLLQSHPEYGLAPVGFLDDLDGPRYLAGCDLPVLGRSSDLNHVVRQRGIGKVIVAFGDASDADLAAALRNCEDVSVELYIVPRLHELGAAGPDAERLWYLPLVQLRRAGLQPAAVRTKRALDIALSGLALAFLSPVYALTALLVRLSSAGPVLFRQRRLGQGMRPIDVLKFRSMQVREDSDVAWTSENDPRITGVGRLLRKTNLDEIPQLLNILRGEMSLVGPRPERPYFVERFSHEVSGYLERHRMPMGLTGWAQVHGLRGDTSIEERVRFDNAYIENWSLWLDLAIMLRTLLQIASDVLHLRPRPTPNLRMVKSSGAEREVIVLAELEAPLEPVPEAVG